MINRISDCFCSLPKTHPHTSHKIIANDAYLFPVDANTKEVDSYHNSSTNNKNKI